MKNIFHSLFWRLSLFFLVSLMAFSSIYIYITYNSSLEYSQETAQQLNRSLAERVATHTKPFIKGNINEVEVEEIFHNVMVLNPSVEVYLLDNNGKILSYYAPFGQVKLQQLSLTPINTFINNKDVFIKGEDPRNPGVEKVFSAAKVLDNEQQVGFLYIILASEEYTTVSEMLSDNFKMKLALKSIIITLLSTLLIGIVMIWFLTKNLNKIIATVNRFKDGDVDARIHLKSKGELSDLANNFDAMADTIVENINEIKSIDNLRKELITNISHDLRTPLTSIQGYAETLVMLADDIDKEAQKKYVNTILSSTHQVKKLVDDLFEISKLESNQIKTKKEAFSIHEMLSDIVMKYDLIVKSKGINFEVNKTTNDCFVVADIALIDRVFQNLIDNAIKHTNKDEKVIISIQQKENKNLEVTIKDTGVGILKDELPYIFDRYKKTSNNTKEGSGLGLAIVKKILDLHNINIIVESTINVGTSFTFSLPYST